MIKNLFFFACKTWFKWFILLTTKPRVSAEDVALKLNNLLKDQVVYSDGWEVDNPWLLKLF
jgi:hypothetical protein